MFITDVEALKKYYSENRNWQGIPSIERTKNGRMFAAFYSGGKTEENGNYSLVVSSNDGVNFGEPIAVADMGENGRTYDACLWIDPLDRLWFIWSVMPDNRVECAICDNPDADTLVWSDVRVIGYDVMLNKPTVLKNGDWLFPCAVWKDGLKAGGGGAEGNHPTGAHVFVTRDKGESFELLGTAIAADRMYDEHMVLEKDDRLEMYIRTAYGIAVSESFDGGVTWSRGVDCGFGGPNSRFHIVRLRSGNILLVNHYRFADRNNLTAMISEDDGKTFKGFLLLDERLDVSYPDVKEGEDGFLYIIYDRERGAIYRKKRDYENFAKQILMAKVTEADILAGNLVNPDSKLKMTISRLNKDKESLGI